MAFSHGLGEAGPSPTNLEVSAIGNFDQVGGGWKVTYSALNVREQVPGMEPSAFRAAAETAKDGCLISGGLKGNVELSVETILEG